MNIKLSKRSLVENLLVPASKLSDNISIEFASDSTSLKTLVTSSDGSTILLVSIPCEVKDPLSVLFLTQKPFFVCLQE